MDCSREDVRVVLFFRKEVVAFGNVLTADFKGDFNYNRRKYCECHDRCRDPFYMQNQAMIWCLSKVWRMLERLLITTKIKDVIMKSAFKQSVHRNRQFSQVQIYPLDIIHIFQI
ncbi:hypothetical protein O6H91_05G122200 [Diphasiastrum complanatum]|nr:hypothetical protein O6H91_05G122200 [Diphasiastrum complanatum]